MINTTYIAHHGIKGQKWGIRRFQNPDGTLTDQGHKRYLSNKKGFISEIDLNDLTRSKDDIYIRKGTEFRRIANSDEGIDEKRKYASVTAEDYQRYSEAFDMLGVDLSKPITEYAITSNKEMRVASGEKVISDLIEKYGGTKIDEYTKLFDRKQNAKPKYDDFEDEFDFLDALENDSEADEKTKKLGQFIRDTMERYENEIVQTYKNSNYDAIVDPEDYVNEFAKFPVIILNPKDTTGNKRKLVTYNNQ